MKKFTKSDRVTFRPENDGDVRWVIDKSIEYDWCELIDGDPVGLHVDAEVGEPLEEDY